MNAPASALEAGLLDRGADFPILARPVRGRRLAYLDNGATTQKPRAVI
jgi:cysteine desulfurase/selenocysteine lyase